MSGKITRQDKVILRTRNGRTHTYAVMHPYKGPTAPNRQRTLDTFAAAVTQAKTILNDPEQRTEWEQRFADYTAHARRYPTTYPKPCTTLRGYIISTLTKQLQQQSKPTR